MARFRIFVLTALLCVGCTDDPAATPDTSTDAGGAGGAGSGGSGPTGCAPGTTPVGDECVSAGIPAEACGVGFESDDDGGCEPILPATACGPGQMAAVGESSCRPVGDCGDGKWGNIPVDSNTVYVDGSYTGGSSDGSETSPYTEIHLAVTASPDDATYAVAEGSYGSLLIDKPARVWGRCPELVEIIANSNIGTVGVLIDNASGSEMHGVAVTGPGIGMAIQDSTDVVIDSVWVHDLTDRGISVIADFPASVTIRGSLIAEATDMGIIAANVDLNVQGTVVRSTRSIAFDSGMGIGIRRDVGTAPVTLTVSGSLVADNHNVGISTSDVSAVIEDTVVRDTKVPLGGESGWGIFFHNLAAPQQEPAHTVRRSLVERSHKAGIVTEAASVLVEHTVVRETLPSADSLPSMGVLVLGDFTNELRPGIHVAWSLIENNHDFGVLASGGDLTVRSSIVRGGVPDVLGRYGRGIQAQLGAQGALSSALVTSSLVEDNHELGLVLYESHGTMERTLIRGTKPRDEDGAIGDGVAVQALAAETRLALVDSAVEGSARAGVANFGGAVSVANSAVGCNGIDLNGENWAGQPFSFEDAGGNLCGCPAGSAACTVLSSGIAPPLGSGE